MSRAASDIMRSGGPQGPHRQHLFERDISPVTRTWPPMWRRKAASSAFSERSATELGKNGINVNFGHAGPHRARASGEPTHDSFGFVEMLQAIPGRGPARKIAPARLRFSCCPRMRRFITGPDTQCRWRMIRW